MSGQSLAGSRGATLGARLSPHLRALVGLALVMAGALAVRLLWLDADVAMNLTWSGAPFTDEGLYSHAARNRALWGTWRTDGWDNRLVGPLFDGLAFLVFSVLGVGYVQLRLISVLLTVAAAPLLWDALRRDWGPGLALLGLILWSFDYFWFQYSRLGLLEPGMVALLVAAAFCWRRALDEGWRWAVAAGMCAALAWVWKSLALVFLPAPLLALLLVSGRRNWTLAVGYGAGLGVVFALYAGGWYWPQRAAIDAYNSFYVADRVPDSVEEALRSLARHTLAWRFTEARAILGQSPILLAAGLLGALAALRAAWRGAIPPMAALGLAWLVSGSALLVMPYSPPRYYTLLLPPLVILAVSLVAAMKGSARQAPLRLVGGGLLIGCLLWNAWHYAAWAVNRQSSLPDASRGLGELLPPGAMVLGVHACGLSLENSLRCAPPFAGLANDHDPVEVLGADYAVVEVGSRDDYMHRFYPELLERSERLATFTVGPRQLMVYRLADDRATAR